MTDQSEPLVILRDVGVQFARNRRRHRSVRELLIKGRTGTRADEFWPFRNVSFDIYQGEAVGVVGRNGQGKSTLLSIIAGVLIPDEGTVDVRAGVAPLIAITGGFVALELAIRHGKRFGLQTMCEGGGIANVTIVEALH